MERLIWQAELQDKVSASASRISGKLMAMSRAFSSSSGRLSTGSKVTQQAASSFTELGAAVGFAGLGATAAVVATVGVTAALGKAAMSALTLKENSLAAFQTLTGSAEKAQAVMTEAQVLGKMTPFSTEDVIKNYQKLLGAGFKMEELNRVFQAVGDAASLGTSEAAMSASLENMTRGIVQMKAKGVVQMDELRQQIMDASNGYLNQGAVFEQIAKQMKIPFDQVDEAIQGGRVSAEVGVYAIAAAIEKRSGKLGTVMEAQSKTITGMWSSIKSAQSDFFMSIDLKGAGYTALRDVMKGILEVFDPASSQGKVMVSVLNSMMDGFGFLIGILKDVFVEMYTGFRSATQGMDIMEGKGDGLKSVLKGMAFLLKIAAVSAGWLFGAFAWGVAIISRIVGGLTAIGDIDFGYAFSSMGSALKENILSIGDMLGFDWIMEKAIAFGTAIVDGVTAGIRKGISFVSDAVTSMADAATGKFTSLLAIHSPSRVFAGYGENTAEGYALGVDSSADTAALAIANLGSAKPGAVKAGRGGGSVNVTMNLSVDARGGNGDEIAHRLSEILPGQLRSVFEQLAMEAGVY